MVQYPCFHSFAYSIVETASLSLSTISLNASKSGNVNGWVKVDFSETRRILTNQTPETLVAQLLPCASYPFVFESHHQLNPYLWNPIGLGRLISESITGE